MATVLNSARSILISQCEHSFIFLTLYNEYEQECIPVGCIPPAHWSYLCISSYPMHAPWGATTHAPWEQPRMPPRETTHAPPPREQPCTPPSPQSDRACPPCEQNDKLV